MNLLFLVVADVLDITADNNGTLKFPFADLATFIFVLSAIHPEKHDQAIQNLGTFIKPGGSLFIRDYGARDHAMTRFSRESKILDRFYARQDGTRWVQSFFLQITIICVIFRAFYFYSEELKQLFERNGFIAEKCEYLFKKTTNFSKQLCVDRVFVQGRFRKV